MEKIIDTILKQKIETDLCKRFKKIIDLTELKRNIKMKGTKGAVDNDLPYEDLDDLKVKIIDELSDDPDTFIKSAFGLKAVCVDVEYTISGENYDKYEQAGNYSGNANIPGYSQILLANETRNFYSVHPDDRDLDLSSEAQMDLHIHIITPFEKKVYYSCEYKCYSIPDQVLFDEIEHFMTLEIVGVRENENIPAWLLDLIESASNLKVKNIKMAFLNAFTALDYYIEELYAILFEHYIEKYSLYSKKSPCDTNYLKEKIRRYSSVGRNLLDEKLKDIWKETGKNNSYFSDVKSNLKILVVKRNKLAHGDNVEIKKDDYGKLLYYFFDLVCLINENHSLADFLNNGL